MRHLDNAIFSMQRVMTLAVPTTCNKDNQTLAVIQSMFDVLPQDITVEEGDSHGPQNKATAFTLQQLAQPHPTSSYAHLSHALHQPERYHTVCMALVSAHLTCRNHDPCICTNQKAMKLVMLLTTLYNHAKCLMNKKSKNQKMIKIGMYG